MQNLWQLEVQNLALIEGVSDSLQENYRQRLKEFGLAVGEQIQCVRRTPFGGPKVFRLGDQMFALDRAICEQVKVRVQK